MSEEWTKDAERRREDRLSRRYSESAWSRWLDEHCGPGAPALDLSLGDDREELAIMLADAGAVCPPRRP